eukprot:1599046-Prymnesium_polylepis.1
MFGRSELWCSVEFRGVIGLCEYLQTPQIVRNIVELGRRRRTKKSISQYLGFSCARRPTVTTSQHFDDFTPS